MNSAIAYRAHRAVVAAASAGDPLTPIQLARALGVTPARAKRVTRSLAARAAVHLDGGLVIPGRTPRRCRTCGEPVPAGRLRHCSEDCMLAAKIERGTDHTVRANRARVALEQGPCVVCGGPIRPGHRVRACCRERCEKERARRAVDPRCDILEVVSLSLPPASAGGSSRAPETPETRQNAWATWPIEVVSDLQLVAARPSRARWCRSSVGAPAPPARTFSTETGS